MEVVEEVEEDEELKQAEIVHKQSQTITEMEDIEIASSSVQPPSPPPPTSPPHDIPDPPVRVEIHRTRGRRRSRIRDRLTNLLEED